METKHTPGPWHTKEHQMTWHNIGISVNNFDESVCITGCNAAGIENWEANARLIAAAPELLEALKLITGHCTNDFTAAPCLEIARAAIAKATGQ